MPQWAPYSLSGDLDSPCDARLFMVLTQCHLCDVGGRWPACRGFKLLSDRVFCSGAWPGAALELISIRGDLWERRGRGQMEPSLLCSRLPRDLLYYQARVSCPGASWDSASLVYPLVGILADLEAFFLFGYLTMTLADKNALLLIPFFKLLCCNVH